MTIQHHHYHRHTTCHRHPSKPITGFCASCLRERLSGIDPDTHQETPLTHLASELRRCKSYSSSSNSNPNNASSSSTATTSTTVTNGSDQPRRKSCDVRSKNTLSDLFNSDDTSKKRYSFSCKLVKIDNLKEEEEENDCCGDKDGDFKTMKEFIDLEWDRKKNSNSKDFSFWSKASVFRNKLVKWQLKHKTKNTSSEKEKSQCGDLFVGCDNKSSVCRLRDTQSEVGGRRSCDTEPRFSIDIGRLSVDAAARYSFDEQPPRASWDGYLIGKTYPRAVAHLVSVVEDVPKLSGDDAVENSKEGSKNLKEGSEDLKNEGGDSSPGGTAQTREFYSDRRRRRSFDRLSSNRRLTLGEDDFKVLSNAKVSPEIGLFHGAKLMVTEKELRDSNWYSDKIIGGESADALAKDVDAIAAKISKKGFKFNKMQRWRNVWNIWGLMHRKSDGKCDDEESTIGGNVIDEQVEESLQKLGGSNNVEAKETVSQKLIRSYTVSARDSSKMACGANSITDAKEYGMKRREDLVLHRNQSSRYSPSHPENGMLRFYLTPLRNYGRSRSGKSRLQNSNSVSRNVL